MNTLNSADDITRLLKLWENGHSGALNQLIEQAYDDISKCAHGIMRKERANHTLQTRALVHEAYFRLQSVCDIQWQNRGHFYSVVCSIMRRILVDHARACSAQKRGGDLVPLNVDEIALASPTQNQIELLALDAALTRLSKRDEIQVQIVELRYIGGLSINQVAEQLAISPATVKRKWTLAQAWLYRELQHEPAESEIEVRIH